MTGLGISPAWISVLGWTLVHFLWQGTAVAIAVAMVLMIVPRPFARMRYAIGWTAKHAEDFFRK